MYKFERYRQLGLADFNQSVGLKMNPGNHWLKKPKQFRGMPSRKSMQNCFQAKPVCLQNLYGWDLGLCILRYK